MGLQVAEGMNLDVDRARSSLRFSFGRYNTDEEVDRALEIIPNVIAKLRGLSATSIAPRSTLSSAAARRDGFRTVH